MRVLLDTDVILDLFLDRMPFADDSAALWEAHEQGRLTAYVSAVTPVNIFYIARKLKGQDLARQSVAELLAMLNISPVNQSVLRDALDLEFKDFEDAVQHASASATQLEGIITRNIEDYKTAAIPVYSPTEFRAEFKTILEPSESDN